MARRTLSPEEEIAIASDAERASAEGADLVPLRSRNAANATAVLSVRVAMKELQALRSLAEKRRISLATLVQDAVASYAASGGPQDFFTGTKLILFGEPFRSQAYNPQTLSLEFSPEKELATA